MAGLLDETTNILNQGVSAVKGFFGFPVPPEPDDDEDTEQIADAEIRRQTREAGPVKEAERIVKQKALELTAQKIDKRVQDVLEFNPLLDKGIDESALTTPAGQTKFELPDGTRGFELDTEGLRPQVHAPGVSDMLDALDVPGSILRSAMIKARHPEWTMKDAKEIFFKPADEFLREGFGIDLDPLLERGDAEAKILGITLMILTGAMSDPLNIPTGGGGTAAKTALKVGKAAQKAGLTAEKIASPEFDAAAALKELQETGGFTFGREGFVKGSEEYMVSAFPEATVIIDKQAATPEKLKQLQEQNKALLENEHVVFGAFEDEGRVFIEPGLRVKDRARAIQLGKLADQKTIGHLKKDGGVDIIDTGGSGDPASDLAKDFQRKFPMEKRGELVSAEGKISTTLPKTIKVEELKTYKPEVGDSLDNTFEILRAPIVDAVRRDSEALAAGTLKKISSSARKGLSTVGASVIHQGEGAVDLAKFTDGLRASVPENIFSTLTPQEVKELYTSAKKEYASLVKTHNLPHAKELEVIAKQGEYLKRWYDDFRAEVEGIFGNEVVVLPNGAITTDAEMFARFFAATSPRTTVASRVGGTLDDVADPGLSLELAEGTKKSDHNNVALATRAFVEWKTGQPFSNTFSGHRGNLERARLGLPFSSNSHKVQSFFGNLWHQADPVTADGWMAKIFGMDENLAKSEYRFIQEAVRREAADLGMSPREYQAALWVGKKTLDGLEEGELLETVGTSVRRVVSDLVKASPEKFRNLLNVQAELNVAGRRFEIALSNAVQESKLTPQTLAIAKQYDAAPVFDPEAVPLWEALASEVDREFANISKTVKFIPVADDAPYATPQAMFEDIERGQLKVSTLNNEHPIFTPEQNFRFRAVHDYLGHFKGQGDFTLQGELRTFEFQKRLHSDAAKQALEVEILGQASSAIKAGGKFSDQKVFIPGKAYKPRFDERGIANMPVVFMLARAAAGAMAGAYNANEEETLRDALIGAGLGAVASPKLINRMLDAITQSKLGHRTGETLKPRIKAVKDKLFGKAASQAFRDVQSARTMEQWEQLYDLTLKERLRPRTVESIKAEGHTQVFPGRIDRDFIRNLPGGRALNEFELAGVQEVLTESAEELQRMARFAIANPSKENVEQVLRAFFNHSKLDGQRLAKQSRVGRSLRVLKDEEIRAQNRYLDNFSKLGAMLRVGKTKSRIVQLIAATDDLQTITRAAKLHTLPGWSDMLVEVWTNGLLSAPLTHATNIVSNTGHLAYNIVAKEMSRVFRTNDGFGPPQLAPMIKGIKETFGDALRLAGKVMRDEQFSKEVGGLSKDEFVGALTAENIAARLGRGVDDLGVLGNAVNRIGTMVRYPGRLLKASDEFFKSIAFQAEFRRLITEEAFAEVRAKGLTGRAARDAFKAAENRLLAMDPAHFAELGLNKKAKDFAAYVTFTNEVGKIANIGKEVQKLGPAGKLFVPFVTAPANIAKAAFLDNTFLGLFTKQMRDAIAKGGEARALALTRMSTGSMIGATVAGWASAGIFTGRGPEDASLRAEMMQNGWKPYSINLSKLRRIATGQDDENPDPREGDIMVEYARFEPLGMILSMAADYSEITGSVDEDVQQNMATAIMAATVSAMTSKTFFKGLVQMAELIDKPDTFAENMLRNLGRSAIPFSALIGATSSVIDPTLRDAQGFFDSQVSRVWPFNQSVKPRYNLLGEKMYLYPGMSADEASPVFTRFVNAVQPFRFDTVKRDQLVETMIRNQVSMRQVPPQIGDVELTPEQHEAYQLLVAGVHPESNLMPLSQRLLIEIEAHEGIFVQGPESEMSIALKKIIVQYKQNAKEQVRFLFDDLDDALFEAGDQALEDRLTPAPDKQPPLFKSFRVK